MISNDDLKVVYSSGAFLQFAEAMYIFLIKKVCLGLHGDNNNKTNKQTTTTKNNNNWVGR